MAARAGVRIGIDVTAAVTQGAGIGRYTRELVRALTAYDQSSDFRLFSARRPARLPVPDPLPRAEHITYRQAPLDARWLYRVWYRLRLPLPVQLLTGGIDLFYSPDFVLPPVLGSIPTLLTVHDLSFVHYPQTFTPALVNYLNRVVPRSVRRATHVLADSKSTKDDLVALWQVPPSKVTVLYAGVDERFRPETGGEAARRVREKYGLGASPYLLSVGTVQPRKNYQMLIRAFGRISALIPHNLVIAGGKGWLYEELLAQAQSADLEGRVRFIGFVDDEDLPALYGDAALFLFPSMYEGFGLPLLEAMACGVPVVTSHASSLPEVAGNAALQLPPDDEAHWAKTIPQLLRDDARRVEMVAAGFRQARQFTWQRAAVQLCNLFQSLLTT
jgi:glycosyltransferase involved in cell wall biosynthesis